MPPVRSGPHPSEGTHLQLLIIAHATEEPAPDRDPSSFPWPLTRAEIDSAAGLLHPVKIELLRDDETPPVLRWRAEYNRTA